MAFPPSPRHGVPPADAPPTALHLNLLGEFNVWLSERVVPETAFPRRKALSLLKVLALQPGYQLHREQVLDLLWPDLTPDSAGTQLYKAIHHARQAFASVDPPAPPDTLLQFRGEVLSLTAPGGVSTDVVTFEDLARKALSTRDIDLLQEAVSLYKGDLLPADLYEPWTADRRDALREQFIDLLVDLGEGYLATGALAEAADALRQVVARDPTREDAHRGLMLAYARRGSRTRALRQYRVCTEALARELGVEVSSETAALYGDLLEERVQRVELPDKGPVMDLTVLPPLVGRQQELRVVAEFLDQLGQGRGAVLGLEGDAGVGKTRLASEILRVGWRRRWHVLLGGAHEQEGQVPYVPFVEALRRALWSDPTGAELIPAELAIAIPEIPDAAPPADKPDRLAAQSALFAGVLRFLAARARTAPVILVLDDLHAADAGSLKLFHYLAREAATLPLLLVGTWRSNEPGAAPELRDIIGSLERQQVLQRLALPPLSPGEHRALLEQVLEGRGVDPLLAAELYRYSEGNALFAAEMARQLAADGGVVQTDGIWRFAAEPDVSSPLPTPAIPRSLRLLSRQRLASLSPAVARLIQLAAVIGNDIPLPVLERGLQVRVSDAPLLDLIDEALAAGVLAEAGLAFRFRHPLLREAIYEQLSLARRMKLHGAIAEVLETLHAGMPDTRPVEALAHHYRHAGDIGRAVHYLIQAGDRAATVYDHDGALHRYGEALVLLQEGAAPEWAQLLTDVQERIGDAHRAIGDVARGLEAYRQALETLAGTGTSTDHRRQFALHRKITLSAILTVNMPVAAEQLAQARTLADPDPVVQAQLLIAESLFAWHALQFDAAIEHASRALEIARHAGARVEESQAYELLALSHLPLGNWEEGLRWELQRHTPDWSPEIVVAIDAHLCLYQYRLHSEESLQQAQQFIESVVRRATTVGNQRCLAVCHFVLGHLARLQGQPDAAAESIARALELHHQIGSPAGVAYTLAQQVELLTAAGGHAAGPRLVEQGMAVAHQAAIRDHCLSQLYTAGIRNRLEAGDDAGVAALIEGATAHDATCPPCGVCRVDLYEALASYHLEFGEPELALPYIDQALQLADYARNRPGRASLVRTRGRIHAARGETVQAERSLLEAAAIFREVGDQYHLARTLQVLATLDDGRDRTELRRQADEILGRYRSASLAL